MKKFSTILTAIALATATGCASAQTNTTTVEATVTAVQPLRTQVTEMVTQESCQVVRVPIYETRRQPSSTSDTIVGAVIGGAIGNQFGGGSGKDAMTVLGAIVGADVANKRNDYQIVTGYRNEEQCSLARVPTTRMVDQGYEVRYEWNGLRNSVITNNYYNVGDTILVRVSFN